MNKTNLTAITGNRLCVTRPELAKMLGCGQSTADIVAESAKALTQAHLWTCIMFPKL